jgi:hypothetical protein
MKSEKHFQLRPLWIYNSRPGVAKLGSRFCRVRFRAGSRPRNSLGQFRGSEFCRPITVARQSIRESIFSRFGIEPTHINSNATFSPKCGEIAWCSRDHNGEIFDHLPWTIVINKKRLVSHACNLL